MDTLLQVLTKRPIAYITRDIERALGMPIPTPGYFIITNKTKSSEEIRLSSPETIFTVSTSDGLTLDTYDILVLPETKDILSAHGIGDIVVFQNTTRIERWAAENNITILNPKADLAKRVEEKVSQIEWLAEDANLLPHHQVLPLKDIAWDGVPFVLQFNRSHTGQGTHIITDESVLKELQGKFPDRPVRVVVFVSGPMITVNTLVSHNETFIGNPSLQITGVKPFTDLPFATVGNDWSFAHTLGNELHEQLTTISKTIGSRLARSGWKGLFGIDAIIDTQSQKMYLIEINARQPASTVFESTLERETGSSGITIFAAHLLALLDTPITQNIIAPINGAQIVQRVTNAFPNNSNTTPLVNTLKMSGLTVLPYENIVHNRDAIRIQSQAGLMETSTELNTQGLLIRDILQSNV